MGDARDPYIWAFKPYSRGAFTCPSCGKEMWRYTPPQKEIAHGEDVRFLCVICDSEYGQELRDGRVAFVRVRS